MTITIADLVENSSAGSEGIYIGILNDLRFEKLGSLGQCIHEVRAAKVCIRFCAQAEDDLPRLSAKVLLSPIARGWPLMDPISFRHACMWTNCRSRHHVLKGPVYVVVGSALNVCH